MAFDPTPFTLEYLSFWTLSTLARQNSANEWSTTTTKPKKTHQAPSKLTLLLERNSIQVRLHTVQTRLSAPPDLLIQKTFILLPLRRRQRRRRRNRSRREERGRVGNVGEQKQLIKHSDSDPPPGSR